MYQHPEKLNSRPAADIELAFGKQEPVPKETVGTKGRPKVGTKQHRHWDEKGFTLIEALMALVILTISLGPALVLSSNISSTASVIQHNLIAANLSQEGVEVVRALRDANWHNGLAFDTELADGIYRIEWNSNNLIALGINPPLKITSGLYNYSSGTDTIFKRTLTITKINPGELRVISSVTWTERGNRSRDVKAESHLFDWK